MMSSMVLMPWAGRATKSRSPRRKVMAKSPVRPTTPAGKFSTTGPAIPAGPTWMCPAVVAVGVLNTFSVTATSRFTLSTLTSAVPTIRVLMTEVSSPPFIVVVSVCAEACVASTSASAPVQNPRTFVMSQSPCRVSGAAKEQETDQSAATQDQRDTENPPAGALRVPKALSWRERGSDLGSDRGSDRGSDLGSDLGSDRGSDLGSDLGSDRGSDLGSDQR